MKTVFLILICFTSKFALAIPDLKPECGLTQKTIESRIQDCSHLDNSSIVTKANVRWDLVARSTHLLYPDSKIQTQAEVWRDSHTNLVWGDALDKNYGLFDGAVKYECTGDYDCHKTAEIACVSDDGKRNTAFISERSFEVPEKSDFEAAETDGIREVVPHMTTLPPYSLRYATATLSKMWMNSWYYIADNPDYWWDDGQFYETSASNLVPIRCVGR